MIRRRQQLASTIQRTVQEVLARGLADPRVRGLITVTGVDLNDETRTVTVRISVLPEEHEALTMHGLRAATTHIRREVMSRIRTREMPRMVFQLDRTVKEQAALLGLINRAVEDAPADAARDSDSAVDTDDPTRSTDAPAPEGDARPDAANDAPDAAAPAQPESTP